MSFLVDTDDPPGERLRRLLPSLSVLAATLLMALPMPLAWGVMPHVALLLVLIWASLQPRLMPTWGAFLLGLFFDLVSGLPYGLTAFLFSAAVIGVRLAEARVERHSLFLDWLFAGVLVLLVQLLTWQLMAFTGQPVPLLPLLVQALLTLAAYPLVVRLAARMQRKLIEVDA